MACRDPPLSLRKLFNQTISNCCRTLSLFQYFLIQRFSGASLNMTLQIAGAIRNQLETCCSSLDRFIRRNMFVLRFKTRLSLILSILIFLVYFLLPSPSLTPLNHEDPKLRNSEYSELRFEYISKVLSEPRPIVLARQNYYKLIVLVATAPQNTAYRTAVRLTWGRQMDGHNVRVFFVCGIKGDHSEEGIGDVVNTTSDVITESEEGGDTILLELPRVTPGGRNSSLTLAALEWVNSRFPHFGSVMLANDNSLVNLNSTMPQLDKVHKKRFLAIGETRIEQKLAGPRFTPSTGLVLGSDTITTILDNLLIEEHDREIQGISELMKRDKIPVYKLDGFYTTVFDYCGLGEKTGWSVIGSLGDPDFMVTLYQQLKSPGGSCNINDDSS